MLKIFIDESGNLGYNEGYFIIAMIAAHNPKRIKNIIKSFCGYHSLSEVHATDLDLPKKQFLINKLIKQQDYSVSYIIADKMMIKKKRLFENNNLLFHVISILTKKREQRIEIVAYLKKLVEKYFLVNSRSRQEIISIIEKALQS